MAFICLLTITFCSHQERSPSQTLHIAWGDVTGTTIIPLPVLIEGIDFDSSTGIRHPGRWLLPVSPSPNFFLGLTGRLPHQVTPQLQLTLATCLPRQWQLLRGIGKQLQRGGEKTRTVSSGIPLIKFALLIYLLSFTKLSPNLSRKG